MPDIAMCTNKKCPLRKSCYRFTARPNGEWQDYGSFNPRTIPFDKRYETEKVTCDFFVDNKERK